MVLETTQILNNAIINYDENYVRVYKQTHKNHPVTIWASTNQSNFRWLNKLGLALCEEYTYRYQKRHKCQDIIEYFFNYNFDMPNGELTPFVQCMPEKYHNKDAVQAYREYYRQEKWSFAKWKNRKIPDWFIVRN
jgi:hypothetical protein